MTRPWGRRLLRGRQHDASSRQTPDPTTGPPLPPEPAVDPPREAEPSSDPVSNTSESVLRSALSVLTALGPPLTLVTALMFYFGWARSNVQARYMGLDLSLFGFSTQDYLMQSISTLYLPLLATAVVALGGLGLHQRVTVRLSRPSSSSALRTAGRSALAVGLLMAAVALLSAVLDSTWAPLVAPLSLAVGVAIAAYGAWLVAAAGEGRASRQVPLWQRVLRFLLIGAVIALALFWEVSTYAGVVGRGYALEIARTVSTLPKAVALSPSPLGIQAPGAREERINTASTDRESAVRYRTTGLRFLARSGGRMFLLHDGWTPEQGTVIVLPDNEQVLWQFSR